MARTVLPIVGAVVGAFFGAPQLGYALGALVAAAIPQQVQGPRIGETGAQTSQEGAPRAIVYGTAQVTGNIIASGPLIKRDVEENQGKGGTDVSTEHAYRTFAIRMCEGPIGAYLRIWEDDKLVYDVRDGSSMIDESEKWAQGVVFYLGDEDQLPDPTLQMIFGVGEVPAHRGSAYIVFTDRDLTDRRGSIPQYRAEVTQTGATPWEYDWTSYSSGVSFAVTACEAGDGFVYASGITGNIIRSEDGETWTQAAGTSPGGVGLIYSPVLRRIVAPTGWVGTPHIAYKDDAFPAWTILNPSSNYLQNQSWADGVWADDRYIVVGNGNRSVGTSRPSAYSFDGISWVMHSAAPGYYGVAYSPSLDLLVAVSGTVVGTSSDKGLTWNEVTSPVSGLTGVTWAPEPAIFVAAGSGGVAWSEDGTNWNSPTWTGTPLADMGSVAWSAERGVFVAPRRQGDTHYYGASPDGKNWTAVYTPTAFPTDFMFSRSVIWSDMLGRFVYAANDEIFLSNTATSFGLPVPLSEIVADIHARCDFPADKFDVSELTDMVAGLVLAGDYTGADAINTLRSLYLFDRADYDKKIHYPKRGASVVATLTIDDLIEEPDTSKREQANEYPKKLHLAYQNAVGGYAVAKATSSRSSPDIRVVGETTVQVPVVLSPDQAAQAAAILHKVAWAEADGEVKISIPDSFIRLVPSNCIGLVLRGRVSRLRIEQMDVADGVIILTMRYDRQSAYTSNVTGIPIPEPTPPPATITGTTVMAFLDIASRIDSEDDLNYYLAVTGAQPAWYGAVVQRSLDGGANYTNLPGIDRAAIMGTLLDDVAGASEHYTDATNVVRVQIYRGSQTINALTDVQFLSEQGAFALEKADGSYEILQFRDVDDEGDGVFALSMLHRGLLNSEPSAHLAGGLFVMLERAVHIDAQSAWIGQELTHRPVSYDQSPETALPQTDTYTGRSQIEWPVEFLTVERDLSDVITGSWIPRHRFGSDVAPVESINFRGFRVTLDDGVLDPVVLPDQMATSFTYDASALGTPLTVSVAPINRITGAGPATSESI